MRLCQPAAIAAPTDLESVLAECDERMIRLALAKGGRVRTIVPDRSPDGVPLKLAKGIREHEAAIAAELKSCPHVRPPSVIPFVSMNLESAWVDSPAAPLTLFNDQRGRTFYRLTPRVWHFINAAIIRILRDRTEAGLSKSDHKKLGRRQNDFCAQEWILSHYRRDQFERGKQYADKLPDLRPGEHPIPYQLVQRREMASRNRYSNRKKTPVRFPIPLWFDLPGPPAAF